MARKTIEKNIALDDERELYYSRRKQEYIYHKKK